jgi:predicted DNA-binding protein with PD1-like motif
MESTMLKPLVAVVALVVATLPTLPTLAAAETPTRYVKTPTGYLMVLRRGDDVIASIEKLADAEKIPSASLTGIGFLSDVTFGFYDFGKKQFDPKPFKDVEMAGMTGSIAWKDGKPSVHAHATVAGRDFAAAGGHVLSATVGTGSVEITVIAHDKRLERKVDPDVGANVLQLD